jgi:hypothetical protein
MDAYLKDPTSANAAASIAALKDPSRAPSVEKFPGYLQTYCQLMIPTQVNIGTSPFGSTSILKAYIDYAYTIPVDERPQSVCEMAYTFWAHIANQQFRAFTMYAMYTRMPDGGGNFTYDTVALKGWNKGDSPFYPEMQAQTAQQIVDSYVKGDAERILFTSAMPPRQTTTTLASTGISPGPVDACSVIESGLFIKKAVENGSRLIPEGEVLATWHFYAEWNSGACRFNIMGPVLYSGTLNPDTGVVSKTDDVLQLDQAAGDTYLDPNTLIVFEGNDASNDERTLGNPNSTTAEPQVGCWSLLTLEAPDGSVLTGISNAIVTNGPTYYDNYDAGSINEPSTSPYEVDPANGAVFGLQAQFVGAEDSGTTGAALTSLVGQPTPDLSMVCFDRRLDYLQGLAVPPDYTGTYYTGHLQRSQFLTFTSVGMDLSGATTDIGAQLQAEINPAPGATPIITITIAQSMPVMTGVGLGTYTNPKGAGQILTPVNLYAYHLNRFGPASTSE